MPDLSYEIEIASNLARTAGEVIMKIYQEDFAVMCKGINDPVTEADQQANTIIEEGLQAHFPQDSIVAEESPLPSTSADTRPSLVRGPSGWDKRIYCPQW